MDPNIVVDFELQEEAFFLCIRNLSEGPAFDLKFEFSTPLYGRSRTLRIDQLPVFRRLRYLAPRKEIRIFVDTLPAFLAHQEERELKVRIRYKVEDGDTLKKSFPHDLRIYEDLPLHSSASSI
ncbi:MAG: hypothetical protein KDC32_27415 [Saprospiraceae bacterium]|nr:hypothetical protein [Saprospiraceae bacterium]MCB0684614.1 hypothetical protein [Saprospiraceae bacterium]